MLKLSAGYFHRLFLDRVYEDRGWKLNWFRWVKHPAQPSALN